MFEVAVSGLIRALGIRRRRAALPFRERLTIYFVDEAYWKRHQQQNGLCRVPMALRLAEASLA